MKPNDLFISRNWETPSGDHDGGIAAGIGFTIAWQRGPLKSSGRNGAFLIEVLEACLLQLDYFQKSRYACDENREAMELIGKAIDLLYSRKNRRIAAGTYGTTEGNC